MTAPRLLVSALATAVLVAGSICAWYVRDYTHEQRALSKFLDDRGLSDPIVDPIAAVRDLTAYLSTLPDGETTRRLRYVNPLYGVLRARPIDVLQHGGFCGNKSRLLVALLGLRGIPARLSYIYNPAALATGKADQPYVTAFVEVRVDDRWIVADPLLGLVFHDGTGRPVTSADLAARPDLVRSQAPAWYTPEVFDYREIRGIRWAKFPAGERLQNSLVAVLSPALVNAVRYPLWVQRPNLVVAVLAGAVGAAALILAAWIHRRYGARSPAGSAPRAG